MTEHDEQSALIEWAEYNRTVYPELEWLYAVPNGAHLAKGARSYNRLAAEGLKKGVPDLCLPVARRGYIGMYLELKFGKNDLSDDQLRWFVGLDAHGHLCRVCRTWDLAREYLEWYLAPVKEVLRNESEKSVL